MPLSPFQYSEPLAAARHGEYGQEMGHSCPHPVNHVDPVKYPLWAGAGEQLGLDHGVRLLEQMLGDLDWSEWEGKYSAGGTGRPPIHPRLPTGPNRSIDCSPAFSLGPLLNMGCTV